MGEVKKLYGIRSTVSKKFFKGIAEESKSKAWKRLRQKIGADSFKWRWEARVIQDEHGKRYDQGVKG